MLLNKGGMKKMSFGERGMYRGHLQKTTCSCQSVPECGEKLFETETNGNFKELDKGA